MTKSEPPLQVVMMPTDAVVLEPVGARSDDHFDEMFASQFQYVWNSLRRLGIPARDLEDVTHDVFLRVYKERHRYDPARPIRPWLFAFAFRIGSDYRKRACHRLEILEPSEKADPQPTAADQLERAEMISAGHAALETLEPGRRAVFILYELDGCAMQEISTVLGIPINTAYSRLRLAREQFQQSLTRGRLGRGAP